MKLNSLIEYLLTEKIRSKSFNIRELKAMQNIEEISAYVHETLEPISEGSSRAVFILSSGKVLKLAKLDYDYDDEGHYDDETDERVPSTDPVGSIDKGAGQNEAEFTTYMEASPEVQKLLPRIYDYDRNFYWLISELVKPLHWDDWTTFEKASGVSKVEFNDFRSDMREEYGAGFGEREEYEDSEFLTAIYDLFVEHDISVGDVGSCDQWGTTTDGRLVLLDAGGTNELLDRLYETE